MAGIITFGLRTAVLTLYEEYFFTGGRLRRHPLTHSLAADFATFAPILQSTLLAELQLVGNRYEADAAVEFVDMDLDGLLVAIAAVTLIEAKNDRGSPPYALYFANQRPSDLRRPILGSQLDTMRTWPSSLKSSPNEVLVGYGTKLEGKTNEADECENMQRAADTALSDFRTVGGRKTCIDEFNARRKALHGKLGELQHQHPELGTGWADSFFRHGSGSDKPTLREIEKRLAAAEEEVQAPSNWPSWPPPRKSPPTPPRVSPNWKALSASKNNPERVSIKLLRKSVRQQLHCDRRRPTRTLVPVLSGRTLCDQSIVGQDERSCHVIELRRELMRPVVAQSAATVLMSLEVKRKGDAAAGRSTHGYMPPLLPAPCDGHVAEADT